jgi:hypothetical protein
MGCACQSRATHAVMRIGFEMNPIWVSRKRMADCCLVTIWVSRRRMWSGICSKETWGQPASQPASQTASQPASQRVSSRPAGQPAGRAASQPASQPAKPAASQRPQTCQWGPAGPARISLKRTAVTNHASRIPRACDFSSESCLQAQMGFPGGPCSGLAVLFTLCFS